MSTLCKSFENKMCGITEADGSHCYSCDVLSYKLQNHEKRLKRRPKLPKKLKTKLEKQEL